MAYPLLSRLFLSRYRVPGVPSIPLAPSQIEGIARFNRECAEGKYAFEDAPCLCASSRSYCVGLADRYGLACETRLCLRCGTLRTSPRLTEESLGRFYVEAYPTIYQYAAGQTEFSPEKRAEERFQEQQRRGETLLRFMRPHLPSSRTPVVFDVGCSTGGALLAFKKEGCACYGSDLGGSLFSRGRAEGLTLVEGTEEALAPYAPADFIILSHVIEHLPHPLRTLKNLHGLLRDGGVLYVELPGASQFHTRPLGMMQFLQNAHLWHFTLRTLMELLQAAGFSIVRGDQAIHAYFRKEATIPAPSFNHPIRARLMALYVFGVEILYRLGLLKPLITLRNVARRGARHIFRDLHRWVTSPRTPQTRE